MATARMIQRIRQNMCANVKRDGWAIVIQVKIDYYFEFEFIEIKFRHFGILTRSFWVRVRASIFRPDNIKNILKNSIFLINSPSAFDWCMI
jgi:hypothetical protein